jgi:hypothetical protein
MIRPVADLATPSSIMELLETKRRGARACELPQHPPVSEQTTTNRR